MKSLRILASLLVLYSSPGLASGEAAKELVRQFRIPTYSVTRKDDDLYEALEGYIIRTRYCYVYVYYTDAVITDDKIIFVDDDEVCDIEGIYRR
jgi:hypothetical protein